MPISDRDIKTNYSILLDPGEEKVIKISAQVATILVEVVFPDGVGTATVYSSIDANEAVNAVLDGGADNLNWVEWDLGAVNESSGETLDIAYAPNALKFVNSSALEKVRFNYRGNFA